MEKPQTLDTSKANLRPPTRILPSSEAIGSTVLSLCGATHKALTAFKNQRGGDPAVMLFVFFFFLLKKAVSLVSLKTTNQDIFYQCH